MGGDASKTEVLVIGSGIAGCAAALGAAEAGGEVALVTKASKPSDASTDWAQGGIAVTRGDPASLREDIMAASADTADPEAIETLLADADEAVEDVLLDTLGIPFERHGDSFDFAREAAHSEARILHVRAATGEHILRPFLNHLEGHPLITIHQDTAALTLIADEEAVRGAMLLSGGDAPQPMFAGSTILATGGIGSLYARSTNPPGSTGDGIAMAARRGAALDDMEFVQFHPTGFDAPAGESTFLISEAVRGAGAVLRNGAGRRFMDEVHPDAELAPRDIVARAITRERESTGRVILDVTGIAFEERFPGLASMCGEAGVDLDEGIPVAPCQHFLCGGIAVDGSGRTSLERLFAVGECARTGLHGANRLAGMSLLEGLVWGGRAGREAVGIEPTPIAPPTLRNSDPPLPDRFADEKFVRLRSIMESEVGIHRTTDGLERAASALRRLKGEVDAYVRTRTSRRLYELHHGVATALLIAEAAASNPVSTGCHTIQTHVDH